ncbi:CoA pyrophosphatase [Vibrio sp.]|uniref:CoA pyrophosphatase n=1 Tax=Vibrio sp. TaxID=678 RepID=UPI003D143FAC
MSSLDKSTLIQKFQMRPPQPYPNDVLRRVAHLRNQPLRKAAVLIGFVERPQGLQVLFTKRAKHLKHHPGQVCFPGGRYEESDASLVDTALRETFEEVGIAPKLVDVFGAMPQLTTISRFSVTPYLAFINSDYQPDIDVNEVAEIFEVPIEVILDPYHLHSSAFNVGGQLHRIFGINYQGHFIWGVTAQIIHALQRQLGHEL